MASSVKWTKLFGNLRGTVIGMIHVQALPGELMSALYIK